jgi:hypothetical protein
VYGIVMGKRITMLSSRCLISTVLSCLLCALKGEAFTFSSSILSNYRQKDQLLNVRLDAVDVNEFFKKPVPKPLRDALSIFKETDENKLDGDIITLMTAAPGSPGVPRPLWLVLLASLPTGLLWYGYYKFAGSLSEEDAFIYNCICYSDLSNIPFFFICSQFWATPFEYLSKLYGTVEEELLQIEVEAGKEPRGFGGYGTLGPFTYVIVLGLIVESLKFPPGPVWATLSFIFIYYTQFILYDRVNELYRDEGWEEPLNVWWSIPIFFPFNIIVGLRQVHFLSEYFYRKRGIIPPPADPVAEFFPFIHMSSFSWQDFIVTPRMWCTLFDKVDDIDRTTLPEPLQKLMEMESKEKEKITA